MDGSVSGNYGSSDIMFTHQGHFHSGQDPSAVFKDPSGGYLQHDPRYVPDGFTDFHQEGEGLDGQDGGQSPDEQAAQLEKDVIAARKTKSTQKGDFANKLRQGLAKVNGRRSKSKTSRPVAKEEEMSSNEDPTTSPEHSYSLPDVQVRMPTGWRPDRPLTQTSRGLQQARGHGSSDLAVGGFDFGLQAAQNAFQPHEEDFIYNTAMPSTLPHNASNGAFAWPDEGLNPHVPQPYAVSPFIGDVSGSHSPRSSNGLPPYDIPFDHFPKGLEPLPDHGFHGALLPGSLSSYEQGSVSSDADLSHFMTPPNEGPTLPWMYDNQPDRRASDSSELATTFASNCQVQPEVFRHGRSGSTVAPSTVFRPTDVPVPVTTPNGSPDHASARTVSKTRDLATRRKAQRPASLTRPAGNRSQSYGGIASMSPTARSGQHPLRTSQSQTVLNGRVSKPSSNHASPRHHHSTVDLRRARDAQKGNMPESGSPAVPKLDTAYFTQPSSINPLQPHDLDQSQNAMANDGSLAFYANPQAISSVPDIPRHAVQSTGKSQPDLSILTRSSHTADYGFPQSAPAHQTTFPFSDPISAQNLKAPPLPWVPSQPYGMEFSIDPPNAPSQDFSPTNNYNDGASQPVFAPKAHLGILPASPRLGSSTEQLMEFPSNTKQSPAEFRTERETKPNQYFVKPTTKDFNFSHSTVNDFRSTGGKKK